MTKKVFYFFFWLYLIFLIAEITTFHESDYEYEVSAGASFGDLVMLFIPILICIGMIVKNFIPDIIAYEKTLTDNHILEDVYTMNVTSFRKRLKRDTYLACLSAAYFSIVAISSFILLSATLLLPVAIFIYVAVRAIFRSINVVKAYSMLKRNPTSQTCLDIAEYTYDLDYTSYYEDHQGRTYKEVFPPVPRYYNFFRFTSIIFAAITACAAMTIVSLLLLGGSSGYPGMLLTIVIIQPFALALFLSIKDLITYIFALKPIKA